MAAGPGNETVTLACQPSAPPTPILGEVMSGKEDVFPEQYKWTKSKISLQQGPQH